MTNRSAKVILSVFIFGSVLGCQHRSVAPSPGSTPEKVQPVVPPAARLDVSKEVDTIAFGSCADSRLPQPLWDLIEKANPDLYLATGDNIYASRLEDRPIAKMYQLQSEIVNYSRFRASVPILATWDDHDYGQRDGGAENPDKLEARKALLDVYPNSADLIHPQTKGLYHSVIVGPKNRRVQIVMLDTRWFRSALEKSEGLKNSTDGYQPTKDLTKTLLGPLQWAWLESVLQEPADLRIVVSSIQLLATEHGFEHWGNFPHERERFFDLLKRLKIKNLFVVSGDRHAGEISQLKLAPKLTLIDVTASAINKPSRPSNEPNQLRIGKREFRENFGTAQIDWKKRRIRLELINTSGESFSSTQFSF